MQDPLEIYVEKLLKAKGETSSPESRSRLLGEVNKVVDKALIEALPLKQLDKLENSAKNNQVDDKLVEELLSEVGVTPSKVIRDTLMAFQKEYIKGVK